MLPEAERLLSAAQLALKTNQPAVWVTVIASRGSAPRDAGTAFLVTTNSTCGTIGGGHLEWLAIQQARSMLANQTLLQPLLQTLLHEQAYSLGASLGQCCGGAMTLRYEPLNHNHVQALHTALQAEVKTLYLFGAGHVAQALVRHLTALPLKIMWVDTRDAMNGNTPVFPGDLPLDTMIQITTLITDTPEAELTAAPVGSLVLVMTHSHALDERLIECALKKASYFSYIGLIGSTTKRRLFEQRLSQRGVSSAALAQLVCPIGQASSSSQRKQPEIIALGVAAQLCEYL